MTVFFAPRVTVFFALAVGVDRHDADARQHGDTADRLERSQRLAEHPPAEHRRAEGLRQQRHRRVGRFQEAQRPRDAEYAAHLGHHRRNRTDLELFDYYLPHQSRWLKTYWLYCLLTGFYWSIIPVAGLVYLLMPWAFSARWFQAGPARWC